VAGADASHAWRRQPCLRLAEDPSSTRTIAEGQVVTAEIERHLALFGHTSPDCC
jgi:hypothetical protein